MKQLKGFIGKKHIMFPSINYCMLEKNKYLYMFSIVYLTKCFWKSVNDLDYSYALCTQNDLLTSTQNIRLSENVSFSQVLIDLHSKYENKMI